MGAAMLEVTMLNASTLDTLAASALPHVFPADPIIDDSGPDDGPDARRPALEHAQSGDTNRCGPAVFPFGGPAIIATMSALRAIWSGTFLTRVEPHL
jgi:hypothetical protein